METVPLAYYPSKAKLGFVIIAALALVSVGIWIIVDPTPPPLQVRVAGWIGVPFFGVGLIYALVRLVRPRPSVVLDAKGLYDSASLLAWGFIPWPEIESVDVFAIKNQKMVGLTLKNNDKFLARVSAARRGMAHLNLKMGYPLIAIPQSTISVSAEELASEIVQRMK